jgi:uncharacterized membrane protein YfcA
LLARSPVAILRYIFIVVILVLGVEMIVNGWLGRL